VQQLVFHRRAVVDERTALSNRLIALLKPYFPQYRLSEVIHRRGGGPQGSPRRSDGE
jgi:hypothetical protein